SKCAGLVLRAKEKLEGMLVGLPLPSSVEDIPFPQRTASSLHLTVILDLHVGAEVACVVHLPEQRLEHMITANLQIAWNRGRGIRSATTKQDRLGSGLRKIIDNLERAFWGSAVTASEDSL